MTETRSPTLDAVRAQFEAICRAPTIASAPRLRKLLRYLIDETLAGNPLKESIVGVAVFGRDPGYDPKQDSVVRTEARRLRTKLIEYYAGEGSQDAIIIDLPKGSYTPVFRFREVAEPAELVELAPVPLPPLAPARRVSWRLSAAVAALLVCAVSIIIWRIAKTGAHHSPATPSRRSVAVLDFRNLTGRPETQWLASAIPEMLRADLASGQQVRTIPGENVARMQAELALQPISSPSRQTLTAIRRNLNADIVVSGDYADLRSETGGHLRIDIWAEDARTGDIVASISENGLESGLFDMLGRAGGRLRSALRLEASPASEVALRAASPRDPAAARAYAEGLAHLRRGDFPQARDLLQRAVDLEPAFAPAHAAFSSVYALLGYDKLSRDQAQQAHALSSTLHDPEQTLAIEAQFREANQQWGQAEEAYARLFAQHPDDIEYGLQLILAQVQGHKAAEALKTAQRLRALPPPQSGDPRIDLEAAAAYFLMSDYQSAVRSAARAAQQAAAAHARLLYARSLSQQSAALLNLGDAHWEALAQQSRDICTELQDWTCVSDAWRRMGNARVLGAYDFEGAGRDFAEALRIARNIGSASGEVTALNGMALATASRGDLARAIALLRQVVSLSRQIPDRGLEQLGLDNLGDALFAAGELQPARESLQSALTIARELHHSDGMADELWALAQIAEMQGDLPRARQACGEALALQARIGPQHYIDALEQNARLLWLAGDLPAAQNALTEAARLRQNWPDKAGTNHLLAALVALSGGHAPEAAAHAREAAQLAGEHHQVQDQARAEAVLAQALAAQGDWPAARAASQSAVTRMKHTQFRLVRLEVAIAAARLRANAVALLPLIAEARSRQAYELALEGRLAAAAITHDRRLAAIQQEAAARGFQGLPLASEPSYPSPRQ